MKNVQSSSITDTIIYNGYEKQGIKQRRIQDPTRHLRWNFLQKY